MIQGPKKFKIISDHLGSVRMVIDLSSNSVVQEIDYDEYGVVLLDSNPGFQPFGFAGGITDQHTNLVRFGARDYMAEVGRWTAKDPMGFGATSSSSLYEYAGNSPTIYIDRTGLDFELPDSPEGLGPEWELDPTHKDPNGVRYRDPSGRPLDFHGRRPGVDPKKWKGKDHWHDPWNSGREHLPPGSKVPDPAPRPGVPPPGPLRSPFWPGPFPIIINPCLGDPSLPGCSNPCDNAA